MKHFLQIAHMSPDSYHVEKKQHLVTKSKLLKQQMLNSNHWWESKFHWQSNKLTKKGNVKCMDIFRCPSYRAKHNYAGRQADLMFSSSYKLDTISSVKKDKKNDIIWNHFA